MFLFALLSFAVLFRVDAYLEWEFGGDSENIQLTTTIGTPGQTVSLSLYLYHDKRLPCPSLWIQNGEFNTSASSTFEEYNEHDNYIGGRDRFSFDDGDESLSKVEFNIIQKQGHCSNANAFLTLAPYQNDFIESVFKTGGDQTVAITYENTPVSSDDGAIEGLLTFGYKPDVCDKWVTANVTENLPFSRWGVELDRVTVGKFSAIKPGPATFNLNSTNFALSTDVYNSIAEILQIADDKQIPCTTSQNIVFTINGSDLILYPDDYIDRSRQSAIGKCFFFGHPTNDNSFSLPYTLFSEKCLLFDFKNKQVAFSRRIDTVRSKKRPHRLQN